MQTIIGTCSLCSGPVIMPVTWHGMKPPPPRCDDCGATQAQGYGPIIRMERPLIGKRAAVMVARAMKKESEG